jgi:hypothetical protein
MYPNLLMNLNISVISKDEFRKLLMETILKDKKAWTPEEIFETLLTDGFPKLDFDDLNKCLTGMFVYLPTVAVEFGDAQLIWIVSGMNAMLVHKENIWSPPKSDSDMNHDQPCYCPVCC